ncbi:MAG: 30S ribosome-binding factor RbfA [Alphaproteobacteria bacterium]
MAKRRRGSASADGGAAPLSQRQLRVGEAIRQALAELILRGHVVDRDAGEVIATVTEVRVSPDLKNATGFVVPTDSRGDDVLAPLNRMAPVLRGELARMLHLKYAPRLSFVADRSFDNAASIDALLRRPDVARDLVPDGDNDNDDGNDGDPC